MSSRLDDGGGLRKDKKFIGKIIRQILAGESILHVVNDKRGTPTYTHDFAANVHLLLERDVWVFSIWLVKGRRAGWKSRKRFVRYGIRMVGSRFKKWNRITSRQHTSRLVRVRVLVNRRLSLRGLNTMRPWREALTEYVAAIRAEVHAPK